ncbi:MAG: hypothetical protein LBQ98_02485 [Nitrososphaerota archaeon]|nr:hypothetical protein [Nitrososphaerota archaeon]
MSVTADLDAELRHLTYKIEHMAGRIGKYGLYRAKIFREIGKASSLPAYKDEMDTFANNLTDIASAFDPSYGLVANMTSAVSDVLYFPKRELHSALTPEQHAKKLGELSTHIKAVNRFAKVIKFKLLKVNEINELFTSKFQEAPFDTEVLSQEALKSQDIAPHTTIIVQLLDELELKLDEFKKTFVTNMYDEKYTFAFELGEVSVIMHELFEAEGKGRARSGGPGALYECVHDALKTLPETLEVLAVKRFVGEANEINLEKTFDGLWEALNNIRKGLSLVEADYVNKKNMDITPLTLSISDAKNISTDISLQVKELKKIDLKLKPPLKDINRLDVDDAIKKIDARLSSVKAANNMINDALDEIEKTVNSWTVRCMQK